MFLNFSEPTPVLVQLESYVLEIEDWRDVPVSHTAMSRHAYITLESTASGLVCIYTLCV